MESAVEILENLNSNTSQQDSSQLNVETDKATSNIAESQNVNQPQQKNPEPIDSQNNNTDPAGPSADISSTNEPDAQNNLTEEQNTQSLESNDSQENSNEDEVSDQQENAEENKQPEKAKKKKNKKKNDGAPSEERKGQVMSYVKALMGMHYMKNDGIPAEVLPGFYLGSIGAAFNKKHLEENQIGHILCCCDGVKEAYPQMFKYKMLKLMDKPSEDITRYFEEASDYIHDILTRGEKVLVHCFAGKSRSTTIMISYLLKHHNMSVDQAIQLIRSKRSVIQPNLGFVAQLRTYEKKLKEKLEQIESKSE